MSISKTASLLLAWAALVAAHGYVSSIVVDGTTYGGYLVDTYYYESNPPELIAWSTNATDDGYVAPTAYDNTDIICHRGSAPGALSAPVIPGGSVKLTGIPGQMTITAWSLPIWPTVRAPALTRTITIPDDIEAGNYVLRHEIIALHSAEDLNGAQNYPQCINLNVTGSGTASPSGTLGEDLYKDTDPSVLVDIWDTLNNYTIPGPALYTAGSTSTATSAAISTTDTTTSAAAIASISTQTTVAEASATNASATKTSASSETTVAPLHRMLSTPELPLEVSQPKRDRLIRANRERLLALLAPQALPLLPQEF
ncbi:endoglucanase-4 precursor [Penicillium maclennaniae]|uniref:endoglucanase-4 precursor n=1 Tax=Penicillium maclennaniae TaxID=1343394 RepID=UPI00254118D1|nr:endoglucanase-4 precursor [Penicillium maclennaniae]KAJ5677603.1 endoglucanase-4 precursor [Penicillium maclennaniae]